METWWEKLFARLAEPLGTGRTKKRSKRKARHAHKALKARLSTAELARRKRIIRSNWRKH